jgi:drug/metabolite transporter (DMT)-like permease
MGLIVFGLVGWVCMQITYSHGNVSVSVPLFAVIQSVVTLVAGYFVFGEQLGLQKIAGTATIVLGVVIVILSSANEVEMETA